MNTFTQGQTVETRSICNYDCIFSVEIIKRTPKTATVKVYNEVKRCKIHSDDEGEFIMPMGQYSMAPVFRPGREA